jgi:hypothetical protein
VAGRCAWQHANYELQANYEQWHGDGALKMTGTPKPADYADHDRDQKLSYQLDQALYRRDLKCRATKYDCSSRRSVCLNRTDS